VAGVEVLSGTRPTPARVDDHRWFDAPVVVWTLRVAALLTVGYVVFWWCLGTTQADFAVYLRGARHVLHGHALYAGGTPTTRFTYPPFGAFLFTPLGVLPVHLAQLVWGLVTLTLLYAVVRITRQRLGEVGASPRWLPGALLLLAPVIALEPIEHAFQLGQVDIALAALCLYDLGPSRLGRLPKGVLVGVAAAVKLTPFLFVPYLVITRRWRQAAVAVTTFAALGLLGMAAGVHQAVHFWTHLVLNPHRVGHLWSISNQSLTGTVDRWIGHVPSGPGWDLVLVVVAAAGLLLAALAYARAPLAGDVIVGLTALLVSPVSWTHHFVWLVPAVLIFLAWSHRHRGWLAPVGVVALILGLEVLYWVPNGSGWRLHPALWESVVACSYTLVAVLVMVGLVLAVCRPDRSRRTT
jgi:alpha-1,2-mannosyltransferase